MATAAHGWWHRCRVMDVTYVRDPRRGGSPTGERIVCVDMSNKIPFAIVLIGAVLLAAGSYYGLAISPPEEHMGDVQRILYVHVPTAWSALLVLTFAFGCAIAFLVT